MVKEKKRPRWVTASVNEIYGDDPDEGIEDLDEGDTVVLEDNKTWYQI